MKKVLGIVLILVGLGSLAFGMKFNSSAEGYRSESRTAPESQKEMYRMRAVDSETQGTKCLVGGVAALALGGVLLFLRAKKSAVDPAPPTTA